ncbi:hypothetical protein M426DRAFT_11249 [Hypoxylon sp. CI-4A]|nr:hypothetical protein M426DRAFT_11249 [Hypoxylon sp. CI-4A]
MPACSQRHHLHEWQRGAGEADRADHQRQAVDARHAEDSKVGAQVARDMAVEITFEDGSTVTEAFLSHSPIMRLNGPFAEQLGLKVSQMGASMMFRECSTLPMSLGCMPPVTRPLCSRYYQTRLRAERRPRLA